MTLYNPIADIHATLEVRIMLGGDIEPFVLGPLSITGLKDPRATVDIGIGPTDSHIKRDGAVIVYFITAGISVDIELSPNPSIRFITKIA